MEVALRDAAFQCGRSLCRDYFNLYYIAIHNFTRAYNQLMDLETIALGFPAARLC